MDDTGLSMVAPDIPEALYRFSVLQATESWAGPGNEATTKWLVVNYAVSETIAPMRAWE